MNKIFFYLLLFLSASILSQNSKIDSLNNILAKEKTDTINFKIVEQTIESITGKEKIELINSINAFIQKKIESQKNNKLKTYYRKKIAEFLKFQSNEYQNIMDIKNALLSNQRSLAVSVALNDSSAIASTQFGIGMIYEKQGNILKALELYRESGSIGEAMNDYGMMEAVYTQIAYTYQNLKDSTNALYYYKKTIDVGEEIQDIYILGFANMKIGGILGANGNLKKSLIYFNKALHYYKQLTPDDYGMIPFTYEEMALTYSKNGDSTNAIKYLNMSIEIKKTKKRNLKAPIHHLGVIYFESRNYIKAIEYFQKSLTLHNDSSEVEGIISSNNYLAESHFKLKKYKEAEKYALISFGLCKRLGYPSFIKKNSELLFNIYKAQNKPEKALPMFELYIEMKDSIYKDELKKSGIRNQFENEYAKKVMSDSLKTVQERKINIIKTKEEQTKRYFLYCGLFLVIVFAGFIFNRFRVSKHQNKLITEQKSILEHQKQEITDSINYSKRIQTAILPDLNDIKQSLNDFFILYQPKDIVSGDFYYFNKVNSDVFMAAADCTGHGVPGAFMSLVGSKELKIANAISNSPAQILKHLNNGVKDTLRQNHIDGTKDGMDIALVRINGTTVRYSAANRPLWILKKDSSIIEEIKATKTAIAGFTEDNFEFDEHEISLSKGDTIYLFSDGYADQFGGDKQKKMTTKRFREFVLSIKDKSMNEQQLQLESFFNSWQGNSEQVDDLLVIGIRL